MDTVEAHPHSFPPQAWPFPNEPMNRVAFASAGFIRAGLPVLLAYHDHDGDWQFLHGDVTDEHECLIVCLGCALEREPAIAELADLPIGWRARRSSFGEPWLTEPYEGSEDEA